VVQTFCAAAGVAVQAERRAVALLRVRGYTVHRLEDGFPEWKAAGLPVEGGAGVVL
jgi:hypothetical protein